MGRVPTRVDQFPATVQRSSRYDRARATVRALVPEFHLFADRADKGQRAIDFFHRVYVSWARLEQLGIDAELLKLADEPLVRALAARQKRHKASIYDQLPAPYRASNDAKGAFVGCEIKNNSEFEKDYMKQGKIEGVKSPEDYSILTIDYNPTGSKHAESVKTILMVDTEKTLSDLMCAPLFRDREDAGETSLEFFERVYGSKDHLETVGYYAHNLMKHDRQLYRNLSVHQSRLKQSLGDLLPLLPGAQGPKRYSVEQLVEAAERKRAKERRRYLERRASFAPR